MNLSVRKEYLDRIAEVIKVEMFIHLSKETVLANDYEQIAIDLTEYDLEILKSAALKIETWLKGPGGKNHYGDEIKNVARRLNQYVRCIDIGDTKPVGILTLLEGALMNSIRKLPRRWLFREWKDGKMLPYLVAGIKYSPGDRDTPADVTVTLLDADEMSHISWSASDLFGAKRNVVQLLAQQGYVMENQELFDEYAKSLQRTRTLMGRPGIQYSVSGKCMGGGRWGSDMVSMIRDGSPSKAVYDPSMDENDNKKVNPDRAAKFWSTKDQEFFPEVPIHPYLRIFHLEDHLNYQIHGDFLEHYVWKTDLMSKLVLPEKHKSIIHALIKSAQGQMEDIISGKTGGVIVLCQGDPGTGKTLTAEIVSESNKMPLYKVQCSQLGINLDTIEKNLKLVLARATAWQAQLLIDEADVYTSARGTDIHQNAIVGTFLRVLEYYRGVMFMTTNRGVLIDDAIRSRCIAKLTYHKPEREARLAIWKILLDTYKVEVDEQGLQELAELNVSGRDIKNLIRLGKAWSEYTGKPFCSAMIEELEEFVLDDEPATTTTEES